MKWLDLSHIAKITGLSKSSVSRRAKNEFWRSRDKAIRGGYKKQYDISSLSEDIKTKLFEKFKPVNTGTISVLEYEKRKGKNQKRALARSCILSIFHRCSMSYEEFAFFYSMKKIGIPESCYKYYETLEAITLYRWEKMSPDGDYIKLVSRYGETRGGAGEKTMESSDKALIQEMYLTTNKLTLAHCYRSYCKIFPDKNISYSTIKRYIKTLPPALIALKRFGSTTFNDKFMPYIPRNYNFPVMSKWCSDHHMLDAYAIDENGKVYRPWITVFQDMRSRKIVGYAISKYPSTYSILEAFFMAVMLYGPPELVYFDNGKDYRGKTLHGYNMEFADEEKIKINGILEIFRVDVQFCWPYHGQSKPVERWFRTVLEEFSKTLQTFIGSNTAISLEEHKANWKQIKNNINITVTEVKELFTKWVADWNANWKHQGNGMNGRTPDSVFNEGVKNWIKIEMPEEYINRLFITTHKIETVHRNGIKVEGIYYYNPFLIGYLGRGQKLIARRQISNIGFVRIYNHEDEYICDAWNNILIDTGATDQNIRNIKHAKKSAKKHLESYLEIAPKVQGDMVELIAEDAKKNKQQEEDPPAKTEQAGFFA